MKAYQVLGVRLWFEKGVSHHPDGQWVRPKATDILCMLQRVL